METPKEDGDDVDESFTGDDGGEILEYSEDICRKELTKFIISLKFPFDFAQNSSFVSFVQECIQPRFERVSRKIIKDIAFKMFCQRKMDLSNALRTVASVSLTCEVWLNSYDDDNYICITAHWIDDNFFVQKRILSFLVLEHSDFIPQLIASVINDYGLNDKIFSITFDGISTDDAVQCQKKVIDSSTLLNGNIFYVDCACHALSSCVEQNLQEFRTLSNFADKHYSDKWNFTYEMLKRYIPCGDDDITMYDESERDHTVLICHILEPFYDAVSKLSAVYAPTSCIVLFHLVEISEMFSKFRGNDVFGNVIASMEEKIRKYWDVMSCLICLAAIMDPRISLSGVEKILDQFYKNMKLDGVEEKKVQVSKLLRELYSSYDAKYRNKSSADSVAASSSAGSLSSDVVTSKILALVGERKAAPDELSFYLEYDHVGASKLENFDVLSWWKSKGHYFPVMTTMARDLLTMRAATAAPSTCFSAGMRTLDDRRNRMDDRSIETSICLKDWFDADERSQDPIETWSEEEPDEEDEFE